MRRKHPTKIRLTQEEALELEQEIGLALAKAASNVIRDKLAYFGKIKENTMQEFLGKRSRSRKRASLFTSLSALEAAGKAEDVLAVRDRDLEHAQGAVVTEADILHLVESFNRPGGRDLYDILQALIDHRSLDRKSRWRSVATARAALRAILDR